MNLSKLKMLAWLGSCKQKITQQPCQHQLQQGEYQLIRLSGEHMELWPCMAHTKWHSNQPLQYHHWHQGTRLLVLGLQLQFMAFGYMQFIQKFKYYAINTIFYANLIISYRTIQITIKQSIHVLLFLTIPLSFLLCHLFQLQYLLNYQQYNYNPTFMRQQPRPVPQLRKGIYYTITNCANGLALSMPKTNKFIKDKPELQPLNPNNINQLWMIQQISPNLYEIVHAYSTLVLESITNTTICKLQFGKQKYTQIFYLQQQFDLDIANAHRAKTNLSYQPPTTTLNKQQVNEAKLQKQILAKKSQIRCSKQRSPIFKAGQRFVARLRIKQRQHSRKYLYCDNIQRKVSSVPQPPQSALQSKIKNNLMTKNPPNQTKINTLKFMEIDIFSERDSSLWQISQVKTEQNQILAQTGYISSFRSGDVLDVPQASDKQGTQIIQYACNFRFNQKWILKKVDEVNGYGFYMIMNAKTGLYLDIKGQILKQGTPIIQWENHQGKNQIWRFEQQGRRTYLIRSALDKDLLLGVKQNSIKECAEIVTSKIQTQSFWIIHGFIPE